MIIIIIIIRRHLASGECIVSFGVCHAVSLCMCACHISLNGEDNALYPCSLDIIMIIVVITKLLAPCCTKCVPEIKLVQKCTVLFAVVTLSEVPSLVLRCSIGFETIFLQMQ